ncbi:MAG: PEP-CTERM sorting domain-containing protein [Verrucomicrobiales bacterium]|nr:PEP-CTERM sorting domain-containing protein [Verrucomicrobiales bacterium]
MTKASVRRTTSLALLSATLLYSSAGLASIVYDNSTTDLNRSYFAGNGIEFGDEVFLTGNDRTITDFRFETFLSSTGGAAETGVLVFRLNDGALLSAGRNAPGTEFYRSGSFNLTTGRGTVVASGLSIPIPGGVDHFTWSVELTGIDVGEQAGLMLYNPPTVGTSFDDFWQRDGATWNTFLVDGGATPANFAARITAVPEPGTMALGLVGALTLVGLGLRRRHS